MIRPATCTSSDVGNRLVLKISTAGVLTVVAGNGFRGFSGDGGRATSASLGQGAILDTQARLVDSAAPAARGEVVQVFATGMGATQPRVPSGQAAPGEPLARVLSPVEARVGGQAARVLFAGLAPGFVGLYQVNVEIPAGVSPGSAVSLVLLQNGVPGNTRLPA